MIKHIVIPISGHVTGIGQVPAGSTMTLSAESELGRWFIEHHGAVPVELGERELAVA
jgi:hypothetical protein